MSTIIYETFFVLLVYVVVVNKVSIVPKFIVCHFPFVSIKGSVSDSGPIPFTILNIIFGFAFFLIILSSSQPKICKAIMIYIVAHIRDNPGF